MHLQLLLSLTLAVCLASAVVRSDTKTPPADPVELHHWRGVEYHNARRLDEASREYARALDLEPARDLTPDQLAIVRRFAPRIYTTPTEPFALEDFAVIVHPTRRLIAYHFFWDDDIDFPEDNDPCDHELMWVQYSADARDIEAVWMYFHGRILAGGEPALRDARAHGMRPRVNVQWGKHGSMPAGWDQLTMKRYNEETYRTLVKDGRRLADHPIGQRLGWPRRFAGTWEEFVDFSRLVDPLPRTEKTPMAKASRWNSATINRHFLPYNFRPKTEWPADAALSLEAASLDIFDLPAKAVFDPSMPRYPNLWIYIDTSLADSYLSAVRLLTGGLRTSMGLEESYGPFSNPEGCDYEARLEHLQPWESREQRALQHSHAFHIRYYHSALARQNLERVTLDTRTGRRDFYRLAASVHYEVEHTNPNHADVETCPICGRTGAYAGLAGNLVELVHDPLGLELALSGTIRGEAVRPEGPEASVLRGLNGLTSQFSIRQFVFPAAKKEQNTLRVGVAIVSPQQGR